MANTLTSIQLTETTGGVSAYAYAGNGEHVVFVTTDDLLGSNLDNTHQLYYIMADGSALRQITAFAEAETVWWVMISHMGNRLVARVEKNGLTNILSIDLSNDNQTWLSTWSSDYIGVHAIAPDGSYIVYETGISPTQVHYIETDGSNYRPLSSYNSGFIYVSADASTYVDGSSSNIVAVDVLGTRGWVDNTRVVMEWPYRDATYINVNGISADGNKIAFYTNFDFDSDTVGTYRHIYLVNLDGTGFTRVTPQDAVGHSEFPHYLLDTNEVVFTSRASLVSPNPDNSKDLYLYNADVDTITQLTNFDDGNSGIQYYESANRNRIVYSRSSTMGGYDTRLIDKDGSNEIVVNEASGQYGGTLSVDGQRFVYLSEKDILGTNTDNSVEVFIRCESEENIQNACSSISLGNTTETTNGGGGALFYPVLFLLALLGIRKIC